MYICKAHCRNTFDVLIARVRWEQKRFQQALEVVCNKVRIPEIIGRVPGRRASDSKSPAAVHVDTVA